MRHHNQQFPGGPGWGSERHGGFQRHRGFGPGGRGGGGKRGADAPDISEDEVRGWLAGRLPEGWFTGAPEITVDREEILVVGPLAEPEVGDTTDAARAAAARGRIKQFREDTRDTRMQIAAETERRYGRTVSWGASIGEHREHFTTVSVPVMTRLRQDERAVLDTLVDAGVARSRSHALAWCVRLVAQHQGDWIGELRDALVAVDRARAAGPEV
ncbi:MAG TPA: hypothetical protein VEZ46_02285 [Mycobacteriales bacterium]|jgi:hypothetical protein|nr:hypothetical protein [Mycobacteriales bacterium]